MPRDLAGGMNILRARKSLYELPLSTGEYRLHQHDLHWALQHLCIRNEAVHKQVLIGRRPQLKNAGTV